MSDSPTPPPSPALAPLRLVLHAVLSVLLILWTLLEWALRPIVHPIYVALGRLRVFALMETGLGRLPPYLALLALAIPFVIIEPIKAFALYWFGIGHFVQGAVLYVISHLLSILIVERVYHAAHGPLMQIGWFARLMAWLDRIRHIGVDWAKSTSTWKFAARIATEVRNTALHAACRRR